MFVAGSVQPDARTQQALLFSRDSSVVRDVDPGQMYSIPYFTMYVSFYTDNEEQ